MRGEYFPVPVAFVTGVEGKTIAAEFGDDGLLLLLLIADAMLQQGGGIPIGSPAYRMLLRERSRMADFIGFCTSEEMQFLTVENDVLIWPFMAEHIAIRQEISDKRQQAGKLGGRPAKSVQKPNAFHLQSNSKPNEKQIESKGKEKKGNEIKEKESKTPSFSPSSEQSLGSDQAPEQINENHVNPSFSEENEPGAELLEPPKSVQGEEFQKMSAAKRRAWEDFRAAYPGHIPEGDQSKECRAFYEECRTMPDLARAVAAAAGYRALCEYRGTKGKYITAAVNFLRNGDWRTDYADMLQKEQAQDAQANLRKHTTVTGAPPPGSMTHGQKVREASNQILQNLLQDEHDGE